MKKNFIPFAVIIIVALFCAGSGEAQMKATALIKGDAVSSSGGAATDVSITVYKGTEVANKTKLTPEGKFTIVLQPGNNYKIAFAGGKYYYHEEPLLVPASDKYQEVPLHVTLKELELGKPYIFSNLIFEPKSAIISSNVMTELENIASAMKRNSKLAISATVYPDETPSGKNASAQNTLLSERKSAMIAFFMSKNISPSNVNVSISTNVSGTGSFERLITQDQAPAKGKKKKSKKAPPPAAIGKKVMVPQDAEIVMQMPS